MDVYLQRVSIAPAGLPLLREWLLDWRRSRLSICDGKPAYLATEEEKKSYFDSFRTPQPEKYAGLFLPGANEEVEIFSANHPHSNLGNWRVNYSGSLGWDARENYVLGTLYEAFPEAHPNLASTIGADWNFAQNSVLEAIDTLRKSTTRELSNINKLDLFLETIGYVISQTEPETYFLYWCP